MGAVQAQDYLGAKRTMGMRMQNATDDVIEQAYNEGSILRTHVMRPTWHFVAPADIRWMQALTAPRVNTVNRSMYRRLELDEALFARSNAIIAEALMRRRQLTRAELGSTLEAAGIPAKGLRLLYFVHRAELDAIVCSGPRRGKQFTYMLLEERAPQARVLPREAALAELAQRYFTGHGPATLRDFVWWSGLATVDARTGLELAGDHLAYEVIDDQAYWFSETTPPADGGPLAAYLLPTYDEFLVGYASFGETRKGGRDDGQGLRYDPTIVVEGQVVGSWRRTFKKKSVLIELAPFASFNPAEHEAVRAAARRLGAFLGLPLVLP
jgi:hypothetical protein